MIYVILKIEGHSHNFRNFLHKFVPYNNEKIKWFELNSKYILQSKQSRFLNYNRQIDSEIIAKIVNNHLASNRYYQDDISLIHSNRLIDILDILDEKLMAVIDLLEKNI